MENEKLKQAQEILKEAREKDDKNDHQRALTLYQRSIAHFLNAIRGK